MHALHSMLPAANNKAQPETVALFVSDLHLHTSLPRTTAAFADFLQNQAQHAQQLYLLGDIFEYWAGDDDCADPYNQEVIDAIRAVSDAGVAVYWIAGNRDFLVGDVFAREAGLTRLDDPSIVTIAGQKIVLVHGDAQCTDDEAYMTFRTQVRQPAWQHHFLAMPLAQRKTIIAGLRSGSRAAQRDKSDAIMDVNADAIARVFDASNTNLMIHGHTHRPAKHIDHDSDGNHTRTRYVLPDWDCDTGVRRGGWIAMTADGQIIRADLDGVLPE